MTCCVTVPLVPQEEVWEHWRPWKKRGRKERESAWVMIAQPQLFFISIFPLKNVPFSISEDVFLLYILVIVSRHHVGKIAQAFQERTCWYLYSHSKLLGPCCKIFRSYWGWEKLWLRWIMTKPELSASQRGFCHQLWRVSLCLCVRPWNLSCYG